MALFLYTQRGQSDSARDFGSGRQERDHNQHPTTLLPHPMVAPFDPLLHFPAGVPGGVIPDQQQNSLTRLFQLVHNSIPETGWSIRSPDGHQFGLLLADAFPTQGQPDSLLTDFLLGPPPLPANFGQEVRRPVSCLFAKGAGAPVNGGHQAPGGRIVQDPRIRCGQEEWRFRAFRPSWWARMAFRRVAVSQPRSFAI